MKSVIFIFIFAVNYYVKFVILYVQCSIIVMWIFMICQQGYTVCSTVK